MEKWFEVINKDIKCENIKLILFPYAGGGASIFRNWKEFFKDIKLYAAQYPGRENRMSETPINEFNILLEKIFEEFKVVISDNKPYYLFGHSLGTKIVYELALKIISNGLPQPKGIIVSAGRAPCYKEKKPIYNLDDREFIKEINRFSGTPIEIIENIEIMSLFIPMLRADFIIDETYVNENITKLDIPIHGFMGTEDKELTIKEFKKWKDYTNREFTYTYIEGGHMFINTNTEEVTNEINKLIRGK